jgi:hypothetical protein
VRPINLKKVLLIVNSDSAQSIADANNYVGMRGLDPIHRLGFPWGTSNAVITATELKVSVVPTVAQYIVDHAIECVILSTYTPSSVNPQVPLIVPTYALAAWLSASVRLNNLPVGAVFGYWGAHQSRDTVDQVIANVEQDWYSYVVSSVFSYQLPHGRLGCPDYSNATIAESVLNAGGGSIYTHAVAQAIAAEQVSHQLDMHLLTNVLGYSIITPQLNGLALQQANRRNFPNFVNVGAAFQPSDLTNGSATAPTTLFALCLANNWNSLDITNFIAAPGAWGYNWTSSAGKFGANLLKAGAAAALLSFGEPFTTGLTPPEQLFIYATEYRATLALAAFLGFSNGMGYTVCGDPLYTPYAQLGPYVNPSSLNGLCR